MTLEAERVGADTIPQLPRRRTWSPWTVIAAFLAGALIPSALLVSGLDRRSLETKVQDLQTALSHTRSATTNLNQRLADAQAKVGGLDEELRQAQAALTAAENNPQVPDLKGRTRAEASIVADIFGWKLVVRRKETASASEGTVVSQSPAPRIGLQRGKTLIVFLAVAPPPKFPTPLPAVSVSGQVWGVYVAVAPSGSASLSIAVSRLESMGVPSSSINGPFALGCDRGAVEALGASSSDLAVAVYFSTKDSADQFASALDPPPVGVVYVTIGCND
jgi:hypothetical protein